MLGEFSGFDFEMEYFLNMDELWEFFNSLIPELEYNGLIIVCQQPIAIEILNNALKDDFNLKQIDINTADKCDAYVCGLNCLDGKNTISIISADHYANTPDAPCCDLVYVQWELLDNVSECFRNCIFAKKCKNCDGCCEPIFFTLANNIEYRYEKTFINNDQKTYIMAASYCRDYIEMLRDFSEGYFLG